MDAREALRHAGLSRGLGILDARRVLLCAGPDGATGTGRLAMVLTTKRGTSLARLDTDAVGGSGEAPRRG